MNDNKVYRDFEFCPDFCAGACVDGTCPIALADEFADRGMDVLRNCDACWHHSGVCDDCIFEGSEYCPSLP